MLSDPKMITGLWYDREGKEVVWGGPPLTNLTTDHKVIGLGLQAVRPKSDHIKSCAYVCMSGDNDQVREGVHEGKEKRRWLTQGGVS